MPWQKLEYVDNEMRWTRKTLWNEGDLVPTQVEQIDDYLQARYDENFPEWNDGE